MRTLLLVALLFAAAGAMAQGLSDPTRPPGVAGSAPQSGAIDEVPAGGPQLQSVLISPSRRIAIINGSTVSLGGMVGEAKVVRISQTEVVLRRGAETEVLKMYPGIEKQATKRRVSRQGGGK